jgi:octaprenyl-diphosphate synthase
VSTQHRPTRSADALAGLPSLRGRLDLSPVLAEIRAQLKTTDREIRAQTAAFDPRLVPYVEYACESHGKRLRAALVLLAGGATGGVTPGHHTLATIVELIHLASLIHDDVMDHADTRRGQPTAHAKWGPEVAVLLGDCLFAHALKLCTEFESNHIARRIAAAANDVCQGELLQTRRTFDLSLTIADYEHVIRLKTAALFSVATELGAFLGNAEAPVVEALRDFGDHLGLAYQIYDDCLDLVGTDDSAGKTLGTDIARGKLTLPVLIALERGSESRREDISSVLLRGDMDQRFELIADLHATGAFAAAVESILAHLDTATACLDEVPASRHRDALAEAPRLLARFVSQLRPA